MTHILWFINWKSKNSYVSHNDQNTDQEKSAMKNILKFVEEAFVLARLDNQNVVQASNLTRAGSQDANSHRLNF